MAYGFFTTVAEAFAQVTKNFGDGITYYNIDAAMSGFAEACDAVYLPDTTPPASTGIFGTMTCNTNTGDIVTESGVTINLIANASSSLVNCLIQQARNFQGDNYCNEPDPLMSSNAIAITFGVLAGLCVLGICGGAVMTTCKRTSGIAASSTSHGTFSRGAEDAGAEEDHRPGAAMSTQLLPK